jgi:hypothetical protein
VRRPLLLIDSMSTRRNYERMGAGVPSNGGPTGGMLLARMTYFERPLPRLITPP